MSKPWPCSSGLYEGDQPDVASGMSNLAIDLRQAGEYEDVS